MCYIRQFLCFFQAFTSMVQANSRASQEEFSLLRAILVEFNVQFSVRKVSVTFTDMLLVIEISSYHLRLGNV